MSKRKQTKDKEVDEGSDTDVSLVNVDFDFFDPNPNVDYTALKRLLAQLFQSDAELFALNELADLILSQPLLGTTVKTEGIEGDPYAYLSVLNMHVHQNHPSIKAIREYVLQKSSTHPTLPALQTLLGPEGLKSDNHVAFIFSERLINMPVQVVPPMYRMLAEEIRLANEDAEPYKFTHYLILTRTYRLTPQQAAELEDERSAVGRPAKKAKNKNRLPPSTPSMSGSSGDAILSTYSFHPEDEYIQKYSSHTVDYSLSSSSSPQTRREEDAFGLDVAGRMMLVPAENFQGMIDEMCIAHAVPQ